MSGPSVPVLPDPSCSASSLAADESLWGTAPEASRFVLLEVRQRWAPKPLKTGLPAPTLAWLRALDAVKDVRIGFIRRPRRVGPLALYLVDSNTRMTLRFDVPDEESVTSIDALAALDSGQHVGGARADDPLVLVCTHGQRDVCCSKLGVPVYEALCREPGLDVWKTTHLGGHRFAPVVATLPDAFSYGRVPVERCAEFAERARQGRVFDAKHLRGPMNVAARAQAAMCAQWAKTPDADVRLASFKSFERSEDEQARGRVVVTLLVDARETHYFVDRDVVEGVTKSCGAEAGAVPSYEVSEAPDGFAPIVPG